MFAINRFLIILLVAQLLSSCSPQRKPGRIKASDLPPQPVPAVLQTLREHCDAKRVTFAFARNVPAHVRYAVRLAANYWNSEFSPDPIPADQDRVFVEDVAASHLGEELPHDHVVLWIRVSALRDRPNYLALYKFRTNPLSTCPEGDIYLSPNHMFLREAVLQSIFRHEFGHVLGLDHTVAIYWGEDDPDPHRDVMNVSLPVWLRGHPYEASPHQIRQLWTARAP